MKPRLNGCGHEACLRGLGFAPTLVVATNANASPSPASYNEFIGSVLPINNTAAPSIRIFRCGNCSAMRSNSASMCSGANYFISSDGGTTGSGTACWRRSKPRLMPAVRSYGWCASTGQSSKPDRDAEVEHPPDEPLGCSRSGRTTEAAPGLRRARSGARRCADAGAAPREHAARAGARRDPRAPPGRAWAAPEAARPCHRGQGLHLSDLPASAAPPQHPVHDP